MPAIGAVARHRAFETCAWRDLEIPLAGLEWTLAAKISVLVGFDRNAELLRKPF
jgi:hypothetical protein